MTSFWQAAYPVSRRPWVTFDQEALILRLSSKEWGEQGAFHGGSDLH